MDGGICLGTKFHWNEIFDEENNIMFTIEIEGKNNNRWHRIKMI